MTPPEEKLVTPTSLIVDTILVIVFFAFIYVVAAHHVPSSDPFWIRIWGALTSVCMTSIFWLALQMFRVVLRAQRREHRK